MFTINVKFPEEGKYYVNISVENDVSIAHRRTDVIHVSNPDPGPNPGNFVNYCKDVVGNKNIALHVYIFCSTFFLHLENLFEYIFV